MKEWKRSWEMEGGARNGNSLRGGKRRGGVPSQGRHLERRAANGNREDGAANGRHSTSNEQETVSVREGTGHYRSNLFSVRDTEPTYPQKVVGTGKIRTKRGRREKRVPRTPREPQHWVGGCRREII
jgi:hypothetical protein